MVNGGKQKKIIVIVSPGGGREREGQFCNLDLNELPFMKRSWVWERQRDSECLCVQLTMALS